MKLAIQIIAVIIFIAILGIVGRMDKENQQLHQASWNCKHITESEPYNKCISKELKEMK